MVRHDDENQISMRSELGRKLQRYLLISLGVILFLGLVHPPFLPSVEWVEKTYLVSLFVGIGTGAWVFWFLLKRVNQIPSGELGIILAVSIPAVISFLCARIFVIVAIPVTFAILDGEHIELTFVVSKATVTLRGCRSSVIFETLPYSFDKVCDVPANLRDKLTSGDAVVVAGYGTSYGMFPDTILPRQ